MLERPIYHFKYGCAISGGNSNPSKRASQIRHARKLREVCYNLVKSTEEAHHAFTYNRVELREQIQNLWDELKNYEASRSSLKEKSVSDDFYDLIRRMEKYVQKVDYSGNLFTLDGRTKKGEALKEALELGSNLVTIRIRIENIVHKIDEKYPELTEKNEAA